MNEISLLVDRILESDDYISVLREINEYNNVKTFDEFIKIIQDFDKRVKDKKIKTKLTFNKNGDGGTLEWYVNQGYMGDKDRTLSVLSFDNGAIKCDTSKKFRAPGSTNVNKFADATQLLRVLDGYVYSLDNDGNTNQSDKDDDEKTPEEKEDENFTLDPSVVSVLDKLKADGEALINKFKSAPPVKFKGKDYKIEKGTLMASTEKELIAALEFPRADEIDVYASGKDGEALRSAILRHYPKNGFRNNPPEFRYDMDRTPYFYVSVGKLPVKQTKGPEARAILNYYDGNKVRFQPKEG
jgi:hypothetical protein